MVAWQSYEQSKMHGLVMEIASSEYANRVKANRFYLKTIAEIILFCATHELPLRVHRGNNNYFVQHMTCPFMDIVSMKVKIKVYFLILSGYLLIMMRLLVSR